MRLLSESGRPERNEADANPSKKFYLRVSVHFIEN